MKEILPPHTDDGIVMDWLYYKCRDIAKRTDKDFIEAARFGAKALNMRICADDPETPREALSREAYASIWRRPDERPRNDSIIVLCNGATIGYALYRNNYCYQDAVCFSLDSFYGYWCYKADLWGIMPDEPSYYNSGF